MHFFTSISTNYLPKARVLAKSLKKHCEEVFFTLVVSENLPNDFTIENEPFDRVLYIEDLDIPTQNLPLWIFKHSVVELCTAVKGAAILKLLQEGPHEKVIFLDPDIAVFGDLSELSKTLDEHDIVLTPHQCVPQSRDNINAIIDIELTSLQHGIYNLGFIALKRSDNSLSFARWWRDRLLHFCYADIPSGVFTDQRWCDFVPAFFEGVYIEKGPEYNVCTWNLSHRDVTKKDDTYYVNGKPLQFYHFSGFDSGLQEIMLSVYGVTKEVWDLRDWYIKSLDENGQEKLGETVSKYNMFSTGEPITDKHRKLIRTPHLSECFSSANPFTVDGSKNCYYTWYNNANDDELIIDEEERRISELTRKFNLIKRYLAPFVLARRIFKRKALEFSQFKREQLPDIKLRIARCFNKKRYLINSPRDVIKWLKKNNPQPEKTICYFDHDMGGGVGQYTDNYILNHKDQNALFIIRYSAKTLAYNCTAITHEHSQSFILTKLSDVFSVISSLKSKDIIINSLVSYPQVLKLVKKLTALKSKVARMVFHVHDYFAICPVYVLLDYENNYCGKTGFKNCAVCYENSKKKYPIFKAGVTVPKWRTEWKAFLLECDTIVLFSDASKSILESVYGALPQIEVLPHKIDYIAPIQKLAKTTSTLNIGIIGVLSEHKGLSIIKAMSDLLDKRGDRVRLVLIGYAETPITGTCFEQTGKYNFADIPDLTIAHDIDIFLIPSIWPETFSYTTQEVIEMGMPVACFDIGAPAERVKEYEKGLIIPNMTAHSALRTITEWHYHNKA